MLAASHDRRPRERLPFVAGQVPFAVDVKATRPPVTRYVPPQRPRAKRALWSLKVSPSPFQVSMRSPMRSVPVTVPT